ncbi:MAG TPA: hypothetical protein VGW32_06200 [Pyrinomonadaceae bacterium]|nr:hypothetical protein [Pyrinomonadaceae bacterium]
MINEKFGSRVTSAWNDLRPQTRTLLERAWQSTPPATVEQSRTYDPRADRELSKLLAALDEQTQRQAGGSEDESARQARRLADTCVQMLTQQTQSAEVFAQLIQRAHARQQFARLDELANAMALRLAPSELCDMARSPNVVVRALANEVLTQAPPSLLRALLHDPIDAEVARSVLERQAHEFGLEEAKRTLREIDEFG